MTSLVAPISFSTLKTRYKNDIDTGNSTIGSGDTNLRGKNEKSSIQLSWFTGASLYEGSTGYTVPTLNISFDSVFKDKTFGGTSNSGGNSGNGGSGA